MPNNLFITFEGPDGSGKSTIIKMIAEYFTKHNIPFVLTREPGGSKIAEMIRNIILDPQNKEIAYTTEALLYAASRAQHFEDIIKPGLRDNKIVLCDRFIDSSLVYQGIARQLGVDEIMAINQFAIEGVLPDLTIFFDVDPVIGLQRIAANDNREVNRLDLEGIDFHKQVYNGYLSIVKQFNNRFETVDASKSIEEVFNDTLSIIKGRLDE